MAKNKKNKATKNFSVKNMRKAVNKYHDTQTVNTLNQVIETLNKVQQQNEINRFGIITINTLHTDSKYPDYLTVMRQFIFALTSFLESKYPNILKEIQQYMDGKSFAEIEAILGPYDAKMGYTLDEFKAIFAAQAQLRLQQLNPEESPDVNINSIPNMDIDEDGSEEEAEVELQKIINNQTMPDFSLKISPQIIEGVDKDDR
jgi:hypothetical protein